MATAQVDCPNPADALEYHFRSGDNTASGSRSNRLTSTRNEAVNQPSELILRIEALETANGALSRRIDMDYLTRGDAADRFNDFFLRIQAFEMASPRIPGEGQVDALSLRIAMLEKVNSDRKPPSSEVKLTPWRAINTIFILVLGVYKATGTYLGQTTGPTTLDWILGVLWFLITYWVEPIVPYYELRAEDDSQLAREFFPWFFAQDVSVVLLPPFRRYSAYPFLLWYSAAALVQALSHLNIALATFLSTLPLAIICSITGVFLMYANFVLRELYWVWSSPSDKDIYGAAIISAGVAVLSIVALPITQWAQSGGPYWLGLCMAALMTGSHAVGYIILSLLKTAYRALKMVSMWYYGRADTDARQWWALPLVALGGRTDTGGG
ncbi:hypothetical protein K438DRAFT_1779110 [Mycena galopus ATCC 62051]|nr:hypothetical protein K438DRAFT_1779110 [Mycena galopus ATCC 62051]